MFGIICSVYPGNRCPGTHSDGIFRTASASGPDTNILLKEILLQGNRVVKARGMDKGKQDQFVNLINKLAEKRQFSLLGDPRIKVFLLNLKIDSLK